MMDIKHFTNGGSAMGQAGGIICSEKWENHKNSTHSKIKIYNIFDSFFFGGNWAGRGRSFIIRSEKWKE